MHNSFSWNSELSIDCGLEQIIRIIERFVKDDDATSLKLRSIPKVIIGSSEVHKIIENNC